MNVNILTIDYEVVRNIPVKSLKAVGTLRLCGIQKTSAFFFM